jgi:hypothetical protein
MSSVYLGFGAQGYGVGPYGGAQLGLGQGGVELGTTTLFNPDTPYFLVTVLMRIAGYKPTYGMAMMGPTVPFITNFWPLWEGVGTVVSDIAGGRNATIPGTGYTWNTTGHIGGSLHYTSAGNGVALASPIVLSGSYSVETLSSKAGVWTLQHIVNDPVAGTRSVYTNGVLVSQGLFAANPATYNSLFAMTPPGSDTLEFARIWSKALTATDVSDLLADPYYMFGLTQKNLDELTLVINFMKTAKSSWSFVKTYPQGETPPAS